MTIDQVSYLVFGIVILLALALDLGLLSKKSSEISTSKALYQTLFWVSLAFAFGGFLWWEYGKAPALEYISAYLMEWSLSIDNIFVFILIFTFFNIRTDHIPRALLIGILMAIVFRIIFIAVGVVLVERFHWLLYVFGAFLIYTGIKIFTVKHENEFDPANNPVYKFINRVFPIIHEDISGKLTVKIKGKRFYTNMFVVIIMLATTDIVFALDSIPAVFAIVTESQQKELIIYTDGASRGNPGPGGYGAILQWGGHTKEISGGYRRTTNNRMELMAVIAALESLKKDSLNILIYSDSQYIVRAVQEGWLKNWIATNFKGGKKNKDLWLRYAELAKNHSIRFVWVRGHADNAFNNRCDELATEAADGRNLMEDSGYE